MYEGFGLWTIGEPGVDPDLTSELWNNSRAYALAMVAGNSGYGTLVRDPGFSLDPMEDYTDVTNAPFYDPDVAESALAGGIFVQSVDGFDKYGFRDVEANSVGGVASPHRLTPKTLTVNAILFGKDCCATQYLYRWLLKTLRAKDCSTGVSSNLLAMLDCTELEQDPDPSYFRTMYDVKVASDPEIVERVGQCCGGQCEGSTLVVEWTFFLENPNLYAFTPEYCAAEIIIDTGTEHCIDFDCVAQCQPDAETLYASEVILPKVRYPVKVLANQTWCPVGDWSPSDYFDAPEKGYLEIVDTELSPNPWNIHIGYNGRWSIFTYQTPLPDLSTVDLCAMNFQITHFVPQPGAAFQNTDTLFGVEFQSASPKETAKLPIRLNVDNAYGGTWNASGWTFYPEMPFNAGGYEFVIDNACGCTNSNDNCEIIINENLTWSPSFDYIGTFPPLGCNNVSIQGQAPGTYVDVEMLSIEDAMNGRKPRELVVSDSSAPILSKYCDPIEWYQHCCKIELANNVERFEPVFEFSSGTAPLYNFRVDFYNLVDENDTCLCDEDVEIWCREPDYSVRIGRSLLPGATYRYDPRTRTITASNDEGVTWFDASGLTSGKDGGSPWGINFGECWGVCAVVTAEIRRDVDDDSILSPADDAEFSLGLISYALVGV